ncbi:hypothetical protein RN607_11285 [Demequina capsici]|uniref:Uncharacterized protein n=1 Tax=Demequina capsici TaxID=3075620 RepID=A0AA96F4K0_9MICO|nr:MULTISPECIES: hypothetical protein [unclassified Demequina]WNM23946.1 hypothetical protein RN606_11345 [Demequina sp. OYTSA14]WNM26774.1 hypothetical protein RN607_11285 [Demequina sp. PMTSA13]
MSEEPASASETPGPDGAETAETPTVPAAAPRSLLDRLRRNRMGALAAGLVVAVAVGLLLSVLVPSDPQLLAYVLLGLLVTAAVAATVRFLSPDRGLGAQASAFVATALGVHLMLVTGAVDSAGSGLLQQIAGKGMSIGFDKAVLAALAVPVVSTGVLLCGLVAAIVAGWGPRNPEEPRPSRPAGY